jgi:hypothetical protein
MAPDVARDVGLADPAEVASAASVHLAQEEPDERQMVDDGSRRQPSFLSKIVAECLEDLLMRGKWWSRCRRDHARVAKNR